MMGSGPSQPTTVEDVLPTLAMLQEEHRRLTKVIAEAKEWEEHKDKRMQTLQDHEAYLAKEQQRLQEWDAQVLAREQAVKIKEDGTKHYSLQADTGVISGVFN
jgi:peptidoglycan hydrolase CwlO-like protein